MEPCLCDFGGGSAGRAATHELKEQNDEYHGKAEHVAVGAGINHHEAAHEQQRTFPYLGHGDEVSLKSGSQTDNTDDGGYAGQ